MLRSNTARRMIRWLIAFAMLAALIPAGASVAAQEDGAPTGGTPVTMTFTTIEMLQPPQEWVDDQGSFHVRNQVILDDVTGDIEGVSETTLNGEFVITRECNEEFCEGSFMGWVDIAMEGEAGGWSGEVGFAFSETGYEVFRGVLIGEGANAGDRILIDNVVEEIEDSITLSGYRFSGNRPAGGVNIYFDGCFTGLTQTGGGTLAGGFIMHGPVESSGSFDAAFNSIGAPLAGVVGNITFANEHGELYGAFVESSVPRGGAHGYGSFFLLSGTGAYEGMYGYGKVMETSIFGQPGHCDGVQGNWIGKAFGG